MLEFILDIAFIFWFGEKFGYKVAAIVAILEIIILLCIVHSINMDAWKAWLNRNAYWKKRGPYR